MKQLASTVSATLSLVAMVVAVPQMIPETDAKAATLTKRDPNGASCSYTFDGDYMYYNIKSWGSWDDDWGSGFLDNLRGECDKWGANIWDWQFYYEAGPPPTPGHASFHVEAEPDSTCVQSAIWDASNPTGAIWGVNCYPE